MQQNIVLGVDFKGVLVDTLSDPGSKMWSSGRYFHVQEVDGAFKILRRLVCDRNCRVHVIVACDEQEESKIREWLNQHDFSLLTGVLRDHLHFCRKLEDKAGICKTLGVTHFMSPLLEVLGQLIGGSVSNLLLFQGREREIEEFREFYRYVELRLNWAQVENLLISTPQAAQTTR